MRILAALSGGVDSAVAAARLVDAGHEVLGVHLRTGVEAEGEALGNQRSCCGADDARDARAVAARLGIPFYVVDVAEAFGGVIQDFVDRYAEGRTPNPCVLCNRDVKWGRLRQIAADLGASRVASGHYARLAQAPDGRMRLMRAADPRKDQTYVLHALSQSQLAEALFPLGDACKDEVRDEAAARGLSVATKPDSQDLCFLPGGDPTAFLRERAPGVVVPGDVVDGAGTILGRHEGAAGFTRGQRKGLPAVGTPRYVDRIEPATGRVHVAPREDLLTTRVHASAVNWIDVPPPDAGRRFRVTARIRHAGRPHPATLTVEPQGIRVDFDEAVFAPAPGQALVAWTQDDAVLAGGAIEPSPGERPDRG